MPQLFSNNGSSLIAQDVFIGDILVVVSADFGGRFPLPIGDTDFFLAVLDDGAGALEVVKCTLRNGDSMLVERAQEGTTEQDFPQGSRFDCRISAGTMDQFFEPDHAVFTGPVNLNANALINGEVLGVPVRGESGDTSNEIVVPNGIDRPTIGGVDILLATDNPLVSGMVFMWAGDVLALPANWNLCDGTNGTPDLRGRFVPAYGVGDPQFGVLFGTGGNPVNTDPAGGHNHGGFAVAKILTEADIPTLTLRTRSGISDNSSDNHSDTTRIAAGANSSNNLSTNAVEYINAAPTEHDHVLNAELDHVHGMVPRYYTLAYIQFEGVVIPPVFSGFFADEFYTTGIPITPVDMSLEFNAGTGLNPTYSAVGLPDFLTIDPLTGIISGTPDVAAAGSSSLDYPITVTLTTTDGFADSNVATWTIQLPIAFQAVANPVNFVDSCNIRGYNGAFQVSWDGGATFIDYPAGSPQSAFSVPTGQIIVRSFTTSFNRIRFFTDTYESIDVQIADNLTSADQMCFNLTALQSFNMSGSTSLTTVASAFRGCFNLASLSVFDTSSVVDFNDAWNQCFDLSPFPLFDTSSGLIFTNTWRDCVSFTEFPQLDFSSATTMEAAFFNCSSLLSLGDLNTPNVTNFINTFNGCSDLICMAGVDSTGALNAGNMFIGCTSLVAPTPLEQVAIATVPPGVDYVNPGPCP